MIKPIPTNYKGIRFRSKLEAQWAKFFDYFKIGWEYEPEGFVLENDECYLPDFRLDVKDWNDNPVYFEVKPNVYRLSDKDTKKILGFCYDKNLSSNGNNLYIGDSNGHIYFHEIILNKVFGHPILGNDLMFYDCELNICPTCKSIFFSIIGFESSECNNCNNYHDKYIKPLPLWNSDTEDYYSNYESRWRQISQINYRG